MDMRVVIQKLLNIAKQDKAAYDNVDKCVPHIRASIAHYEGKIIAYSAVIELLEPEPKQHGIDNE